MKKFFRRTLAFCIVITLALSVLCVASNAEEPIESEDLPQDLPPEEVPSENDTVEDSAVDSSKIPAHILEFLDIMKANNSDCTIQYTSDSVTDGVYYEVGYDELTEKLYFDICIDLGAGYSIYDVESTAYIDGIKVNGEYLATNSAPYRIYLTDPTLSYTVLVKTVYSDDFFGTMAKIYNGDADLLDLFSNPIIAFQAIYYILAIISIVLGIVVTCKSKKYKAKSSTEIANDTMAALTDTGTALKAEVVETAGKIILDRVTPVVDACLESCRNVVKAMAISSANSKGAPIDILNILDDMSKINISDVIDNLKSEITTKLNSEEAAKEETVALLDQIAATPVVEESPERPSIF